MKSIEWLALSPGKVVRVLLVSFILIAFGTACTEEAIVSSDAKGGGGNNKPLNETQENGNSNPQSNYGDYNIVVTKGSDGVTWTYLITKNEGAKGLSHFILDLANCPDPSSTLNII